MTELIDAVQMELFNLNERRLQLLGELRSVQSKMKEVERDIRRTFRRCGECEQMKSLENGFHKNSWVCKPCKKKIDHEIYQWRRKAAA